MTVPAVYYVLPSGDRWLLRPIGGVAETFDTFEAALEAADDRIRGGSLVRVLGRSKQPSASSEPSGIRKCESRPPPPVERGIG